MRRIFCILLMLCLPLQGFALQWGHVLQGDSTPQVQEVLHEAMHDAHVSHHHEDDGSVHVDDSDESVQHLQDHSAPLQPATLLTTVLPVAPPELVFAVVTDVSRFIPDPMLECPHRPPAASLGQAAGGVFA